MQSGECIGRAFRWMAAHPIRAALLVIALYLPAAALLRSAVAPEDGLLRPPFSLSAGHAFAARPVMEMAGATLELTEDGLPLGPPASADADVNVLGHGRYSLLAGPPAVLLFSSSDNTDPNQNGRRYRLRKLTPNQAPATFR